MARPFDKEPVICHTVFMILLSGASILFVWAVVITPFVWMVLGYPGPRAWKDRRANVKTSRELQSLPRGWDTAQAREAPAVTYTCQTCGLTRFSPIGVCQRCNTNDGH